jgi:hypothetical protein
MANWTLRKLPNYLYTTKNKGVHFVTRYVKLNVFNSLQTKHRPIYLETQFVPRCKHTSSRL